MPEIDVIMLQQSVKHELPPPIENNGLDHIETEDYIQNPTPEELKGLPDLTSESSNKNVSEATDAKKGTRRYCKWSIKNTNLLKEFCLKRLLSWASLKNTQFSRKGK